MAAIEHNQNATTNRDRVGFSRRSWRERLWYHGIQLLLSQTIQPALQSVD